MGLFSKLFGSYSEKEVKRIEGTKQAVLDLEPMYQAMTDKELQSQTGVLKERLKNGETLDDILTDAFAVCREAMWRVIGIKPYPVQIIGGIVLHQGRIAEMKTGEGKTYVAALPSYLNALTGKGVHVVTVNDYLAKRDSELIGRVHRFLGLTVGLIVHDLPNDVRRESYACDVTYGTNNEYGFDYLRDNMCNWKKEKVQREMNFAIVDEVDSILIDEARTPLIISGRGDKPTDLYEKADKFAKTLHPIKVVEADSKEEQDDYDGDYLIDEKAKTATLLPSGVKKAEKYFGIENLMDADNLTILHHVNQAIKANGCMHLDIEYVVKDGEIVIVDEFTGRLMFGRRFNEGLHQAIEAKEGVKVKHESKTLATITFQNFFRLYDKLSGMTGTAMTEENEFRGIYNLDVIEIPTNKPVIRNDRQDQVYKNENGKFTAAIRQIEECHAKGQPVLVGTISIEKSERLSKMLKKTGIKHEVLNAKNHEREAEIIAQAGKKGAVTIATNMAGRGTDIMLGGNPEYLAKAEMRKRGIDEELILEATGFAETEDEDILNARKLYMELNDKFKQQIAPEAEEVKAVGGLFILGTERHESRRIDNQLRGRAGRQGDPGESCFFVSLEDDLMRLFGGERVQSIMETLNIDEDMPIETGLLTKTIESSQRKIEGRNYQIRKNVLDFDDVMSQQRMTIYTQRGKVLDGDDISGSIRSMITESIQENVDMFCQGDIADNWNITGLREHYAGVLTTADDLVYTNEEMNELKKSDITEMLTDRANAIYAAKEAEYGSETMREIERVILLKNVDTKWMDHIDAMDELKRGIYLRSMGQKDPVVEYRFEGFAMFDEMVAAIREDTVRMILTIRLNQQQPPRRVRVMQPVAENAGARTPVKKTAAQKVGRNDPCPCGSGKKYKKCCGANVDSAE
ncbi:MAG: preprotein translocase subunit SecA [Bacteroides sp.]|nr:preprotein translocase subunit SecA [Eubacterium sp.]MCM1417459.1 preprotein translocase subunit SecA [Roseburia sp.]MCM1461639.1 preprotein translocase subunit SecA [Bacteroides sp.]